MQHMVRKRNDFEILIYLSKKASHIRQIASVLNMVPSTVMRTINSLKNENLVDFRLEGKNKVYFLKDSLEMHEYLFILEKYKLLKLLSIPKFRLIIKKLKENTNNELIILFGSYAKNNFKSSSDIDLYVETSSQKLKKNLSLISNNLSIKIGNFDKNSDLSKEIIKDHVIIQNIERYFQLIK